MKLRELVYIILDESKLISDDSVITEDHVIFLINKYRAMLLKQTYTDVKKKIPESNYQTICIDLTEGDAIDGEDCTGGTYLKSTQEIPELLTVGNTQVYPYDYFQGNIVYTTRDRMKYVGHNKYLKNIIYAALGADNYLYFKSNNPQHKYLEKVKMTGIFEDSEKAAELSCDDNENSCHYLDKQIALEEALVPQLIKLVLQDITAAAFKPEDNQNNSADDLSDIVAWARRNMKSAAQKQIEG